MFLYFVSALPNLTLIQTHHLRIGHVTLIKYKYRQPCDKGMEDEKKMGSQNLLQCIYRVAHVYPSLVLIIFQFFFVGHVSVWLFAKFTVWFVAILGKNPR